jgi:hypothetical protein
MRDRPAATFSGSSAGVSGVSGVFVVSDSNVLSNWTTSAIPVSSTCRSVVRDTERSLLTGSSSGRSGNVAVRPRRHAERLDTTP